MDNYPEGEIAEMIELYTEQHGFTEEDAKTVVRPRPVATREGGRPSPESSSRDPETRNATSSLHIAEISWRNTLWPVSKSGKTRSEILLLTRPDLMISAFCI